MLIERHLPRPGRRARIIRPLGTQEGLTPLIPAICIDESAESCENPGLVWWGSPRVFRLPFRESSSGGTTSILARTIGLRVWTISRPAKLAACKCECPNYSE